MKSKHYAQWTLEDIYSWFAGHYQWTPSQVRSQRMGDLASLCWRMREAKRRRDAEQEAANAS